ncbi:MAG: ester cyclase [Bacilli bacterium]|jgi:predicted SnoaL-like aldol condensation-catalyzing enzyme|nr:ester cyclase [Bacilli bacterium]MCH4202053.1 ester cyclase [Bacilli bacterium]MCH4236308.1 ester cyclase [Bacilli bacterium]
MTNKEVVRSFYEAAYNQKDYKLALGFLTPTYFNHSPAIASSSEDAIDTIKQVHLAFSNLRVEVLELIEEDDLIAGQFLFTGIQKKEYLGVPATNAEISWEAVEIFRINAGGKIIESWGYWPDSQIQKSLLVNVKHQRG